MAIVPINDRDGTILMEDAQIVFRNFTGREGMYNREGDRNFCVILPEELASDLINDGWNVKRLKPRDDAEVGNPYLQVSVGFKNRPPILVLISSQGRVDLGQHECELFDWVDILKADLIIRPYKWDVNGKSGIKAYLKSMFITLNEDYLMQKYADVPYVEGGTNELPQIGGGQDATEGLETDDNDIVDAELVD